MNKSIRKAKREKMPTPPNCKFEIQAGQDIKAGQDLFWYGILPSIGMAARDIAAGEIIEYNSHKNTKDVILKWEENE